MIKFCGFAELIARLRLKTFYGSVLNSVAKLSQKWSNRQNIFNVFSLQVTKVGEAYIKVLFLQ